MTTTPTPTRNTKQLPPVPGGAEILLNARDSHRAAGRECLNYASAAHTSADAAWHAEKAAWNFRAAANAEGLLVELDVLRNPPQFIIAHPECRQPLAVAGRDHRRRPYRQCERESFSVRCKLREGHVGACDFGAEIPSAPADPETAEAAVRVAYHELVRETGFPAVMMSSLRQRSGESLEVVHALARKLHQTGTGVLSLGDWSLASADERAAVLVMGSDRYLQLRFL